MIDPIWYGHRVERVRYDLLDLADRAVEGNVGDFQTGGSIDGSATAPIRWSGSVACDGDRIDWLSHRLRVWYVLDGAEPIPLITAVVEAPDAAHDDLVVERSLQLLDKTSILAGDDFGDMWGYDAGTPIIQTVRDIINSVGDAGAIIVIPDSPLALAESRVWDSDTDKLTIANDLLKAAGYEPLWCDGLGRYRSDPTTDDGGADWTFEYGDRSVYLPEVKHTLDRYRVPNRYRCVQRTAGDVPPATAVATDEDPKSPYSYPGRPWSTRTDRDVEVGDWPTPEEAFAALKAEAQRRLVAAQRPTAVIEISHPVLPTVTLNARVQLEHPRLGTITARVSQQHIDLDGLLVGSTLEGVR